MQRSSTKPGSIRLIAIDIDGTLIGKTDHVSEVNRRALIAARERGCEVVVATGRGRYTALPIAQQLGADPGWLVCFNGAVVLDERSHEMIRHELMPIPLALHVVETIVATGAGPFIYEDSLGDHVESARVLYHPDRPGGPWATVPRYRPYQEPLTTLPFTPVSINTYGPPEKMRPMAEYMCTALSSSLSVIQAGTQHEWSVEVFAKGVNKRTGLELLTARLGVLPEQVLAIGDHINDLEMLKWAGIGVAMGNAVNEAHAAADWITGLQTEDGVARAIERFVLDC